MRGEKEGESGREGNREGEEGVKRRRREGEEDEGRDQGETERRGVAQPVSDHCVANKMVTITGANPQRAVALPNCS